MSFDRLARHYSRMEAVIAGERLQECRRAFLKKASGAKSILLVGEGHGRFLAELSRTNRQALIYYVDASPKMMKAAQQRLNESGENSERIRFHTAPILNFDSKDTFELIVTQFFLDCFEGVELDQVIRKLSALLAKDGQWIIADFQVPRGWRGVRARMVLALAYRFFRLTACLPARSLVDPEPLLRGLGLQRKEKREFNYGLLYAALWQKGAPTSP